jgi:hypothetical protein
MKVTNGKKTLEVTEKAFRVVYEPRGFKEVKETKADDAKKTTRGK